MIGTHGTPFAGSSAVEKIAEAGKKRKRASLHAVSKPLPAKNEGFDYTAMAPLPAKIEAGNYGSVVPTKQENAQEARVAESVVKQEMRGESEYESSDEDSEDEMPLAKLRKVTMGQVGGKEVGAGQGASMPFSPPVRFNPSFLGNGSMAWGHPGQQWAEGAGPGYFAGPSMQGGST